MFLPLLSPAISEYSITHFTWEAIAAEVADGNSGEQDTRPCLSREAAVVN